jgi:hypothetical protein
MSIGKFPGLKSFSKILVFIVVSVLLVHTMSVFGFLVAFAYLIWWFFSPNQIPNLIRTKNAPVHPHNLKHALFNSLLIFVFSLFSLGIIFVESKLLSALGFSIARKTAEFVLPTGDEYKRVGEIFNMKIEVKGAETPVNAVQADLKYDPGVVEVIDISTRDSFCSIFVDKEIDNDVGFARITGGLPNPGIRLNKDVGGILGEVYLKAKQPGVAKIEFLPSSMVLANDGRGTNMLARLVTASYFILPEEISAEEEKTQEEEFQLDLSSTIGQDQLILYEDGGLGEAELALGRNKESILGAQTTKAEEYSKFISTPLSILEKIDSTILKFWESIFASF